jgi:hypothetical protein
MTTTTASNSVVPFALPLAVDAERPLRTMVVVVLAFVVTAVLCSRSTVHFDTPSATAVASATSSHIVYEAATAEDLAELATAPIIHVTAQR